MKNLILFFGALLLIQTSFAKVEAFSISSEQIDRDFNYHNINELALTDGLSKSILLKLKEFSSINSRLSYSKSDYIKFLKRAYSLKLINLERFKDLESYYQGVKVNQTAKYLSSIVNVASNVFKIDQYLLTGLIEEESLYDETAVARVKKKVNGKVKTYTAGTGLTQFTNIAIKEILEQFKLLSSSVKASTARKWITLYNEYNDQFSRKDFSIPFDKSALYELEGQVDISIPNSSSQKHKMLTYDQFAAEMNKLPEEWKKRRQFKKLIVKHPAMAVLFGGMYLKILLNAKCNSSKINCNVYDIAMNIYSIEQIGLLKAYRFALRQYNGNEKASVRKNCKLSVRDCYYRSIFKKAKFLKRESEKQKLDISASLDSSINLIMNFYLFPDAIENNDPNPDARFLDSKIVSSTEIRKSINQRGTITHTRESVLDQCHNGRSIYLYDFDKLTNNNNIKGNKYTHSYVVDHFDCKSIQQGEALSTSNWADGSRSGNKNWSRSVISFEYNASNLLPTSLSISYGRSGWESFLNSFPKSTKYKSHYSANLRVSTLVKNLIRADDSIETIYNGLSEADESCDDTYELVDYSFRKGFLNKSFSATYRVVINKDGKLSSLTLQ